ncbi:putative F-box/kelch-repeat protein [Arabidopsis thaliana]|uniref:F-box domain-containing protein n=2 Tax=Arabidopsis TaxID=3701 RepID=A0A178VXQ6_ARATH|nr:Kelch-type beta propeller [Arabidopsis thaliana x Arabidopsis arenosa]OAP11129.1 hypothetical protein AXX17_AT2G17230 [Arabidopsis thaliana]
MVLISETSDDGSTGGDHQIKKPKKEEDRNKKLKEKVQVSLPIPEELILRCFLLVRRCHHPSLSLVCRSFHSLMSKLYDDRLRLGYTENVLYAYVGFPPVENPSWYILHRKPYRNLPNTISLKLCKIDSLPPMPWGSTVVTIGSDIYVIGGRVGEKLLEDVGVGYNKPISGGRRGETSIRGGHAGERRISDVTLINCRFHEYRSLPSMKMARCRAAAGVIDGKIYVIGGRKVRTSDWVEVFDLKKQSWSSVPGPYPEAFGRGEFLTYAVMKEKIYCLDLTRNIHIYDPKESKWESWTHGPLSASWNDSSCVVDNLLFCINTSVYFLGWPIKIYDPEKKTWFYLQGLQGFPANGLFVDGYKMANFGGKLVILSADVHRLRRYDCRKREIWCIEIAWERQEDGTFWGKVESVAVVLTPAKTTSVDICGTVTV